MKRNRSLASVFCLFLTGCSLTQVDIETHLVGTWACYGGDISKSGTSFLKDKNFKYFHTGERGAPDPINQYRHYATGNYRIRGDQLLTEIQYGSPVTKEQSGNYLSLYLPSGVVRTRYQVTGITSQTLSFYDTDKNKAHIKTRCKKIDESVTGKHFDTLLAQWGGQQPRQSLTQGDLNDDNAKLLANVKTIDEVQQYRALLGQLLKALAQTNPKNIRITNISGQDRHFQILGIAETDEQIKDYVVTLEKLEGVESLETLENRSFEVVYSGKDNKSQKGSQRLYEFRVSIMFKPGQSHAFEKPSFTANPKDTQAHYQQDLERAFNARKDKLVKSASYKSLLQEVSQIGTDVGISFAEFKPYDPTREGKLIQVPISVQIKGTYSQLSSFLERLAKYPGLVSLEGVQIEPDSYQSATTDLTLIGVLMIFSDAGNTDTISSFELAPLESVFPKKTHRTPSTVVAQNDPFHSFAIQSYTDVNAARSCAHMSDAVEPRDLQFLGKITQKGTFSALLKTTDNRTLRAQEGQCLAKNLSITKIMRTKIILKQNVQTEKGQWQPRTVTLEMTKR